MCCALFKVGIVRVVISRRISGGMEEGSYHVDLIMRLSHDVGHVEMLSYLMHR